MTPTRYRKKPVVIEAMRWDGTAECATAVIDWALACGGTIRYHSTQEPFDNGEQGCPGLFPFLAIDTLEGTMEAQAGHFVIRGVEGEFYACKPSVFEQTYEPADGESETDRLRRDLDAAQERSIEARNPGIDMGEMRRLRAGTDV